MSTNEIDTLREILRTDWYALADEGDLVDGFLTVDVKRSAFHTAIVTRTPSERFLRWKLVSFPTTGSTYTDTPYNRPIYVTEVRREVTTIETSYEVSS